MYKLNNMKKEFVPYAPSLRMKALGFDEPCFGWFRSTLIPSNFTEFFLETEFGMNESPSDWVNSNFLDKACSAPLYQQAFRWFREKYNAVCEIIRKEDGNHSEFIGWVYIDNRKIDVVSYWDSKTYEEAELACLNKLIEIVESEKK